MMCSDLCIGTFAAIWAISQTLIHLWWILLGKSKHACPIEFDVDKQSECQDILSRIIVQFTTDSMAEKPSNATQFKIARDIKLTLPSFSETTADILMLIYIILDGIWIVTSVSLLLASCCRFKEKSSLYFYMPWVVVASTLVMFDVYCSVYFGLNIPKSWTLMEWLEMLGIVEQKRFDKPEFSDGFGFRAPVLLMTLFTARFVIIWIINFVLVFAIVRIAKRASLKKDDRPIVHRSRRHSHNTRGNNLSDPSSTEERIRSWQEFYGTLRTNKPRTNASFIETSASGTEMRCIDLECYDSFKNGCKKPSEINSEQCHECATYIALNSTAQCAHPPDVILAGGAKLRCSTCRSKEQQLELVSEVSQHTVRPHKQVEFQGTTHPEPWDSLRRTSLKRSPYPVRLHQRNESQCSSDLNEATSKF